MENDLVPRAGYKLRTVQAYGINRKITIQNFKNMFKTWRGLGEAKKIVKEIEPDIVIGTGGYICGGAMLAAVKNKIPTILHESNAFPGIAVRILARKVDVVLVGFKEAEERLSKAKKIVVTGNPVSIGERATAKSSQSSIDDSAIVKEDYGMGNKPTVLAFGGSQGAKSVNETLIEIISNGMNKEYKLIWACGPKKYNIIKRHLSERGINVERAENAEILPYIYNMEEMMSACDLVISRSGAMTITEVANYRKACNICAISICNRKPSRV